MERIEQNVDFLKAVSQLDIKQSKGLLKTAKTRQLDAICEIILNVIKEVITIPKGLVKKAKKFKKVIRCLARKSLSKKLRRKWMLKYIAIIRNIIAASLPIVSVALSVAQF
jgi:hypothetical protein